MSQDMNLLLMMRLSEWSKQQKMADKQQKMADNHTPHIVNHAPHIVKYAYAAPPHREMTSPAAETGVMNPLLHTKVRDRRMRQHNERGSVQEEHAEAYRQELVDVARDVEGRSG
jgi:hypothetical protein